VTVPVLDPVLFLASLAVGGLVGCSWCAAVESLSGTERGAARKLRDEMIATGMNPAPLAGYLLGWRLFAAGLLVGIWAVFDLPPVAVAAAAIAYHAAPWWVRRRIAVYRRRVSDQVAGVARNLAGQARAGLALSTAFADVARDAPAPLGDHLRRTARDLKHGCGTRQALTALKTRVQVEAVCALAVAIQVADERGGGLADVLDRLALAADEDARVERKREADTASGRLMIATMAVIPVVFLGLVHTFEPRLLKAVTAGWQGQSLLAGALLVVYASLRWGWSILARAR
jgi:tight adherence protein B